MENEIILNQSGELVKGLMSSNSPFVDLLRLMLTGLATKNDVVDVIEIYKSKIGCGRLGDPLDAYVSVKNCEQFFKKLSDAFKPYALSEAQSKPKDQLQTVMGMRVSLIQGAPVREYEDPRWIAAKDKVRTLERDAEIAKLNLENAKEELKVLSIILEAEGAAFTEDPDDQPKPIIKVSY